MALPLPVIPPQPDAFHLAPHRIKRCTFRRLINVEIGAERVYDVECLYPDRKVPIPLGDLEAATPICNACVAAAHLPPRRRLIAGWTGRSRGSARRRSISATPGGRRVSSKADVEDAERAHSKVRERARRSRQRGDGPARSAIERQRGGL